MPRENHVRVGVKYWDGAQVADEETATGSVQVMWVDVDGARLHDVISVKPGKDGEWGADLHTVSIEVIVSKFEFVDYREDD